MVGRVVEKSRELVSYAIIFRIQGTSCKIFCDYHNLALNPDLPESLDLGPDPDSRIMDSQTAG